MPLPPIHDSQLCALVDFICFASVPSPIAVLPLKLMVRTLTFGPSCTSNTTFTSFGPVGSGSTFEVTSANS